MSTAFQPEQYESQLAAKRERLEQLLAPFDAPVPEVFESAREHFRLRAEFRLWYENGEPHYAMFEQGDKRKPILITQLPIASRHINALMMPLLDACTRATRSRRGRLRRRAQIAAARPVCHEAHAWQKASRVNRRTYEIYVAALRKFSAGHDRTG